MKAIKWLDEYLEEVLLVILLVCMVCIMGLQVVMRYLFNQSLSWSEELTQYLFVWTTFISVSYCVKKRISIKIEQVINALPQPGQTGLRLFRHALVFVFCIIMIPYAVTYVQQAIDSQATSAALGIPMYYIQSAPLAGFLLLTIRVIQAFWREANIMVGYWKKDPKAAAAAEALSEQQQTVDVFLNPEEKAAVSGAAASAADSPASRMANLYAAKDHAAAGKGSENTSAAANAAQEAATRTMKTAQNGDSFEREEERR